jgi:hypothetical protein
MFVRFLQQLQFPFLFEKMQEGRDYQTGSWMSLKSIPVFKKNRGSLGGQAQCR